MTKARYFIRIFATLIMTVTFSVPPYAFAAGPNSPRPPADEVSADSHVEEFSMSPPAGEGSNIRSVKTRVVEVDEADSNDVLELKLEQVVGGHEILDVTTAVPDDASVVNRGYFSRLAQIASKFPRAVKGKAVIATRRFSEWFISSRVQIIVFEISLMSGEKVFELLAGPQHAALAPALTASLLIGSIIGFVEWHTPYLVGLYTNHNSYVKALMAKLNAKAESPELSARLRGFNAFLRDIAVNKGYWFLKNASLNTFLYFIFKVILYASLKADGSIYHRVVSGAQMISAIDVLFFFGLGFGATGAGMPTSSWIVRNKNRVLALAGDDPVKLKRVDNLLTFWWSTALTFRAAAFSALLVGYTVDWPGLVAGAAASIAAMSGGSWYLNHRYRQRVEREEAAALREASGAAAISGSVSCGDYLEPRRKGVFEMVREFIGSTFAP